MEEHLELPPHDASVDIQRVPVGAEEVELSRAILNSYQDMQMQKDHEAALKASLKHEEQRMIAEYGEHITLQKRAEEMQEAEEAKHMQRAIFLSLSGRRIVERPSSGSSFPQRSSETRSYGGPGSYEPLNPSPWFDERGEVVQARLTSLGRANLQAVGEELWKDEDGLGCPGM